MKKICKSMAIFAIAVGLACLSSYVSVGDLVGSIFGGANVTRRAKAGQKSAQKCKIAL